jgi:hypothetical protein
MDFGNNRSTSTPKVAALRFRQPALTTGNAKEVDCEIIADANENNKMTASAFVGNISDSSCNSHDQAKDPTACDSVNGTSQTVCCDKLRTSCSEVSENEDSVWDRNENTFDSEIAERLEFEVFDEEIFLDSLMQLCQQSFDISGAGEEPFGTVDGAEVDVEMLKGAGWRYLSRKDDLYSNSATEVRMKQPEPVAIRSDCYVKSGAGEVLLSYLPIADSTSDLFCNWSFSSIGRPTSAESNFSCDGKLAHLSQNKAFGPDSRWECYSASTESGEFCKFLINL